MKAAKIAIRKEDVLGGPVPVENQCRNCMWWDPIGDEDEYGWAAGECHRHAPAAVVFDDNLVEDEPSVEGNWPKVASDGWCGDFATDQEPTVDDKRSESLPGQPVMKYDLIDFEELSRRLPMYSPRLLRDLVRKGIVPSFTPPGCRRQGFHWPSVASALLRFQRGGKKTKQ